MGMYDEVALRCPKCDARLTYQSSAGECILRTHDADDVPEDIADGANDDTIWCTACDKQWRIISRPVTKHRLFLIPEY
jgi:uncharacterized protein YbaR (Trm112 family)